MNMETFTGDARSFHDETPTKFEYQILDVNFGVAYLPSSHLDDWREIRVPIGTPGARDPDTRRLT